MNMFEKEAKERAKDFTDNKERQVAYECGFLDGADFVNKELKENLAGAERARDNLIQAGFPTFQSCKEYAERIAALEKENAKAKELLKWALHSDPEHDDLDEFDTKWEEAKQFLKEI